MTEQTLSIETIAPRTPLQEFWFYFKQNKSEPNHRPFILFEIKQKLLQLCARRNRFNR